MQKNLSPSERYIRGIHRNIKGNLIAGAVFVLVMIIIHLVSGCEPILPNEPKDDKRALSASLDSVYEDKEMLPEQEIDDRDTDTTVYHSHTNPK